MSPTTTTDMLAVMQFTYKGGYAAGYCLDGRYDIVKDDLLLVVKNPKGSPIDVRRIVKLKDPVTGITEEWITDQQTEGEGTVNGKHLSGWDDPGYVKFHVGNNGVGNRMVKRYVDKFPFVVEEKNSPLYYELDGVRDYNRKDAGPTKHEWLAPKQMSWGGDVGTGLTYQDNYSWSGGAANREQLFFVPEFGLVKWNHMELVNGVYKIVDPKHDPPASTHVMTLADWQKTYKTLKQFSYDLPGMSAVTLS